MSIIGTVGQAVLGVLVSLVDGLGKGTSHCRKSKGYVLYLFYICTAVATSPQLDCRTVDHIIMESLASGGEGMALYSPRLVVIY